MIYVKCNLCGADDYSVRHPATMQTNGSLNADVFRCTSPGYGEHPQIVTCNQCGHVYANPRWSEDELLAAYTAVEDQTYLAERTGRELTFRKHLQALEKHTGPANGRSLLDVGAYIGVFVEVAAAAGWDAWGVEPSEWAAAEAQRHGLQVIRGTQDAPELADRQFDVVTLWDVIEHVTDPKAELAKAFHLLKPGGWVVAHTMDIDSLTAKMMGSRWPWFMDMHIHYFSQKTLAEMMRRIGYEVVWSGVQGRYLRLNYLGDRLRAFHQPTGKMATAVIDKLNLGHIAIPINFGDLFTVYARRPSKQ